MAKVGFIGTGIMGLPMAENLQKAGHELYFSSQYKAVPPELLAAGGKVCPDPAAVAAEAEFIITMLPETRHVEEVLFAERGMAQGLSAGKVVIDMSSISPTATRDFARRIAALDCEYLDAPVSGGETGAKSASLTIMVGGSEPAFQRAHPLFTAMGTSITRIGGNGDGQVCKVANQIIVALNIEAVAEALVFASKAGADPSRVRAALMGGFASSRVLEVHGERMIERTFDPGFRIRLHQKDLDLALAGGRELGVALPGTALAQQLFSASAVHAGADADHSALVRALELLADAEIGGGSK